MKLDVKILSGIAFVFGVLSVFSFRKWANLCQRYRLHQPAAAVIQVNRVAVQTNKRQVSSYVSLTIWDLFGLSLTEQLSPPLRRICQMKTPIPAISSGPQCAALSVPVSTIPRMVRVALKIVKEL